MGPLLYARCLGEPLLLDRHRVPVKLRVRKHLALVLFLVVEPRHRASRERLKRMFWPEGKSGQSLSQAVSEIRVALGTDVFDVSEHYIGLTKGIVIERDLDLLSSGDADLLLKELSNSFWGHVLFDGMEIEDAEEWNTWLSVERGRWTERIGIAAKGLLDLPGALPRHTLNERSQMLRWVHTLTGGHISPAYKEMDRPFRWTDVDWRVQATKASLEALQLPAAITIDALGADTASVVAASLRCMNDSVVVHIIDSRQSTFTVSAFLKVLAALPGVLGASTEAVSILRLSPEAIDESDESLLEQVGIAGAELLEAIAFEGPLALCIVGNISTGVARIWRQFRQRAPGTRAWLIVGQHAEASGGSKLHPLDANSLRIRALTQTERRIAASLLAAGTFSTRALAAAHPVVADCLRGQANKETTLLRDDLVQRVSDSTGLPATLSRDLVLESEVHPRHTTKLLRRAPRNASPLDPTSCSLVLMDDEQREWTESALASGAASGHSARAALLWSRLATRHFSPDAAAQSILGRCQEAVANDHPLEDIEALAFALLNADPFIGDLTLESFAAAMRAREPSRPSAALSAARLVLSQQLRTDASELSALAHLSSLRSTASPGDLSIRFTLAYGASLRDCRHGLYLRADRRLLRLAGLALRLGHRDAFERAMAGRVQTSARLGNSSEVLSSVRACGLAMLQRKSRAAQPWPQFIVRAAKRFHDKEMRRIAIDVADATLATQATPRALAIASQFFEECGMSRRSVALGDQAAEGLRGAPLRGQEAEWISVLAPRLTANEMREEIAALRSRMHAVDVRDQQVIRREALNHGLKEQELSSLGLWCAPILRSAVS